MGVFDDKKFQELDWISQATEPIDSSLNDILASLPDEVEITYDMFHGLVGSHDLKYASLSIDGIVRGLLSDSTRHSNKDLSYSERDELVKCFELKINGNEELILNTKERTITGGTLHLIKTKFTMDERALEKLLGGEGLQAVRSCYIPENGVSRANEVMELLGKCESGLRSRASRKKRWAISQRLTEIITTNEWRIRDATLANKVGFWIVDYLRNGDLAAWSNFCRLKVMTHKGDPIYSIEEVK